MRLSALLAAVALGAFAGAAGTTTQLRLLAPISRWDEGIPLGNGTMGALVWGENQTLRISVDRGDLWDLRPAPELADPGWTYANLKKLVAQGNAAEIARLFDACYEAHPHPTKLPVGRVEVLLPESLKAERFELDLETAECTVWMTGGARARAYVDANDAVTYVRLPTTEATIKLIPPAGVARLGYEPAAVYALENGVRFNQRAANGLVYSVVAVWKVVGGETIVAIAADSNRTGTNMGALLELRLKEKLATGYGGALARHRAWWRTFWDTSALRVPERAVQEHYDLVKYFYGAASRRGAPPMPLQGVWTADEGGLPPWKGDYHNDLNTQTTYGAYPTAGLFDAGSSWLEFNHKLLPRYRRFAKEFYGAKGAVVPGVMALDGSPLGGWAMYSLSPTNSAWIAHNFARHWRYRRDVKELKSTIYPFCREIGFALASILEPDAFGKLKLPLSSSPEVHDNTLRAWLTPNSNYDLALMRDLFASLGEMASAVNQIGEASFWYDKLDRLEPYWVDENGLMFAKGEPVKQSHRHFSHLMAIHPLGDLDPRKPEEFALARKSVQHMLSLGTREWTGYSFSWMSAMLARLKMAEPAIDHLRKYLKGFVLRNGFHCNGDQSGSGLSGFTYRPVTLEGNFLAMEAVHEMVLQSHNGIVEVFPSVPAAWTEASFERLRAEGGFKVSASRSGGVTRSVLIISTQDRVLRLVDPFQGKGQWSGEGFRREGGLLIARLRPGEGLRGRLP